MSPFAWDKKFSVGNTDIDDQHKQLFKMADDLHAAMSEGKGKESLVGLFSRLITYTRHHFATEEGIMRSNVFPGYAQHKQLHDKLTQQVLELQKKFVDGKGAISLETMDFLADWLRNHIQGSDQKVGEHIRTRNAALAGASR